MNTIAPPAKRNGKAPKTVRTSRKATAPRRKTAEAATRGTGKAAAGTRQSRPQVDRVDLVAPARTGRTVAQLGPLLDRAEVRLRLAWKYRGVLDPALPQSPPFHAHAWTAFDVLRPTVAKAGSTQPMQALTRLHGDLSTLRSTVALTTRPGDAARAALRFDTPLTLTYALVDIAPAVIEGARSVQARFPALTDAAIDDAERSLDAARMAVSEARSRKVDDAVSRLDALDDRQLALDVLLDCIDHLRAAAKTTLGKTRPRVGEALSAPIEPQRARPAAATDDPPQPA